MRRLPWTLVLPILLFVLIGCNALQDKPPSPAELLAERVVIERLESGSTASLRGLHVVSARVAFASGSGGTLLRTIDGGRSWESLTVAPDLDFRSVFAVDASQVWVASAGQPARVYRSLDASRFDIVHEDPDPAAFFDTLEGDGEAVWLFGDPVGGRFTLRRATVLGASFVDHGHLVPEPRRGEAGFAASDTCVALDRNGTPCIVTSGPNALPRFLRPEIRGVRESMSRDLPLAYGGPGRGAFSLAIQGSSHVVVGGDYLAPDVDGLCVAWSDDDGETFAPGDGLGGYRSCVAAVPGRAKTFVAVGPTGAELTIDGGQNWVSLPGLSAHAIRFAPGGIGFATGAGGAIHRVVFPVPQAAR